MLLVVSKTYFYQQKVKYIVFAPTALFSMRPTSSIPPFCFGHVLIFFRQYISTFAPSNINNFKQENRLQDLVAF